MTNTKTITLTNMDSCSPKATAAYETIRSWHILPRCTYNKGLVSIEADGVTEKQFQELLRNIRAADRF